MIRISEHAISAHFIHEERGMLAKMAINHAPRVGDDIRMEGEIYYKVTRLIWIYDEPHQPFQRLNIGVID